MSESSGEHAITEHIIHEINEALQGARRSERTASAPGLTPDERRRRQRILDVEGTKARRLQCEAAALFGRLNGWARAKTSFTPEALGRVHATWNCRDPGLGTGWMDHAIHYRAPVQGKRMGRNVAIVGQPYGALDGDRHNQELDACATRYGLRWHAAPMPYASFWFPSATLFVVMTLPDIKVRWLPEQLTTVRHAGCGISMG
jgi:hypothetical protein